MGWHRRRIPKEHIDPWGVPYPLPGTRPPYPQPLPVPVQPEKEPGKDEDEEGEEKRAGGRGGRDPYPVGTIPSYHEHDGLRRHPIWTSHPEVGPGVPFDPYGPKPNPEARGKTKKKNIRGVKLGSKRKRGR